ncbi:MAG: PIN domain-containing protein [Candidatus Sulfotelmatobacter sp.]
MIIFDASYLVVMLYPRPEVAKDRENRPVPQFVERVANLAANLDIANTVIGIPAPAMSEVLVRAGDSRDKYIATLSDTWKFQILPFDARAAIEAGELISQIKSRKETWGTWAKVKFDIQIVATAKAESASVIYSDDKDIENLAKRLKIKVVRICDLPLPSPPEVKAIEAGPVGAQMLLIGNTDLPVEADKSETKAVVPEVVKSESNNQLKPVQETPLPFKEAIAPAPKVKLPEKKSP